MRFEVDSAPDIPVRSGHSRTRIAKEPPGRRISPIYSMRPILAFSAPVLPKNLNPTAIPPASPRPSILRQLRARRRGRPRLGHLKGKTHSV